MPLDSISLRPLKTLSFWRYTRLRTCKLSGAFPVALATPVKVPTLKSRSQILGTMFHSLMEQLQPLISNEESSRTLRERFNSIVDDFGMEIANDPKSKHLGNPRHWQEVTDMYRRIMELSRIRTRQKTSKPVSTFTEKTLYSKDGLLLGQIDAMFVFDDQISIVDYKSGSLTFEDMIKEEYAEQLYFYAYLVQETFGNYPTSISLIGRDLESVQLELLPDRSISIAEHMRNTLKSYNELASSQPSFDLSHVTNPSSAQCLYCDAKTICSSFWNSLSSLELPSWANVLIGRQVRPFTASIHGTITIDIHAEKTTISSSDVQVTRILKSRFPDLEDKIGQILLITNIRTVNEAKPGITEVTDGTLILPLGDGYEH